MPQIRDSYRRSVNSMTFNNDDISKEYACENSDPFENQRNSYSNAVECENYNRIIRQKLADIETKLKTSTLQM